MWVRDLHCHYGLVRIVFGVYNNSDNMRHIIKQSIKDYEEYTRFMIRQDNELVVKKIIEENQIILKQNDDSNGFFYFILSGSV